MNYDHIIMCVHNISIIISKLM